MSENTNKTPKQLSQEAIKMKNRKRNSWIIFGALLFIRFFFVEHFAVPSSSMTPTLITGDIILIKKYSYAWSRLSIPFGGYLPFAKSGIKLGHPQRGDIAVFILARDPGKYYVKRIVGLEGDCVQMKNGVLHINGEACKMEFVKDYKFRNDEGVWETGQEYKIIMPFPPHKEYTVYRNQPFGLGHIDNTLEFKVPKGHVWMQGDFHTNSADSFSTHFMGPLPMTELIGKPFFVLYGSNSRMAQEDNLAKWILQLPWRILVALRYTNTARLFISVQ